MCHPIKVFFQVGVVVSISIVIVVGNIFICSCNFFKPVGDAIHIGIESCRTCLGGDSKFGGIETLAVFLMVDEAFFARFATGGRCRSVARFIDDTCIVLVKSRHIATHIAQHTLVGTLCRFDFGIAFKERLSGPGFPVEHLTVGEFIYIGVAFLIVDF